MAATALVLGARNLGAEIASHLSEQGWNVAAIARSEETAATLRDRLPAVTAMALDASDPVVLERAADEVHAAFGSLDLVVNAATPGGRPPGPFGGGPLAEATIEAFDAYTVATARHAFAFLGAGARSLRAAGGAGTLVQITGGSSRRGMPSRGPWAAGAFATRALTQAAAQELRGEGIHVALLVVDATIESPKTAAFTEDTPRDALTTQRDVARAVEYLAGQEPRAWTHELQITPSGDAWVP
jgi:NAD(P)-dependent dehydrogenase (short-subunit alcohol dehydrogenase family)